MIKIAKLFEETKSLSEDERVASLVNSLPVLRPPTADSKQFKKEIDDLSFYYSNPCLSNDFLDLSHNSVKSVFKKYCTENGIRVNWKEIKKALREVDDCTDLLKKRFRRPRPKHYLTGISNKFKNVKDMKSYSFPSGHTIVAYFISNILSDHIPECRGDFENLAHLIGQSRIENAVHFPSDVSYGRLIGELLASNFLENKFMHLDKKRTMKSDRAFGKFLIEKNKGVNSAIDSIANFIAITCNIESISVPYSECRSAAKKILTGVSDDYLSRDPHIKSQCKALRESFYLSKYSPHACIRIHKQFDPQVLDTGNPGEFRNKEHTSPTGVKYCNPPNFYKCLRLLESCKDPYVKHALFEWVHPFKDGNGRIGRIILVEDLNYQFDLVNDFISKDYIKKIDNFYKRNDIAGLFSKVKLM